MLMKTTACILVFVGYVCFGVGMLLGQALADRPTIWIIVAIIAGLACTMLLIPLSVPRKKKKLPTRRNVRIVR